MHIAVSLHLAHTITMLILPLMHTVIFFTTNSLRFWRPTCPTIFRSRCSWCLTSLPLLFGGLVWIWLYQTLHVWEDTNSCAEGCLLFFRILSSVRPKGLGYPEWTQTAASWSNPHSRASFLFVTESASQLLWRCSAQHRAISWMKKSAACQKLETPCPQTCHVA